MKIVSYPHPTLRYESKPVVRIDSALKQIVREMFSLMYEANGIGLAANQVDLPFRLFIVNLAAQEGDGEEHAFINPTISRPRGNDEKEEGCLSLPGLHGQVVRPEKVHFSAYTPEGDELEADLSGLFARVVQHEVDHLDGVLFTDRLSETGTMEAQVALDAFVSDFECQRSRGEIPSDAEIATRRTTWETRYC